MRRWCLDGLLDSVKVGRAYRIRPEAVEAFVAREGVAS